MICQWILHVARKKSNTNDLLYLFIISEIKQLFFISNFDIYLERSTNQLRSKNQKMWMYFFYYARMWMFKDTNIYLQLNYKTYRREISPKHLTNHHLISTITLDYQISTNIYPLSSFRSPSFFFLFGLMISIYSFMINAKE